MHAAVALLATIAGTPNLPGAACVGEREVFDACVRTTGRGRIGARVYERAIRVCASCPVLIACRAWRASLLADEIPFGVTAGLIRPGR